MACACKGGAKNGTYTVTTANGATRTFSSETSANTYAKQTGGTVKPN